MASDYQMLRKGITSLGDFQRLQEEFDLKKQLQAAQIESEKKKLTQVDVDKLGEQAFMKAAMGQQLSPEEQAAAMFIDAKSGGMSFNPVTGEMIQKPRISDKIGLPGMTPKAGGIGEMSAEDVTMIPAMDAKMLEPGAFANLPKAPMPSAPLQGMTARGKQSFTEANIKADRARLDELIASSGSASSAKSSAARMAGLQRDLGYTGFGGSAVGLLDKALTGVGAGGMIPGSPAAREAFKGESVNQWVKAVEPLKGALTEREGARFDAAIPSLEMTPEGIKMMNDLTVALGKRAQEKSQFYQDYFAQNGSLYGADQIWERYAEENPVLPEGFGEKASDGVVNWEDLP